jgi:hypothetical protein
MGCGGGLYDLADRFTGTWKEYTVTDHGEHLVGTLHVSWELDGCVQVQRLEGAGSSFALLAFGYFNPETASWEETFILNSGRVARYRWREEGPDLLVERLEGDPEDLRRLRIRNVTPEGYDVLEESSRDNANTWSVVEVTRTRRES